MVEQIYMQLCAEVFVGNITENTKAMEKWLKEFFSEEKTLGQMDPNKR